MKEYAILFVLLFLNCVAYCQISTHKPILSTNEKVIEIDYRNPRSSADDSVSIRITKDSIFKTINKVLHPFSQTMERKKILERDWLNLTNTIDNTKLQLLVGTDEQRIKEISNTDISLKTSKKNEFTILLKNNRMYILDLTLQLIKLENNYFK